MPKKTESKEINGYTYEVTQMGALTGRRVLARFIQVAGGAIAAISNAKESTGRAVGVEGIVKGLDEETMEFFFNVFAADSVVVVPAEKEGQPDRRAELRNKAAFDDIFIDRYTDMLQWLIFAFEVNFGSFFTGSGALAKALQDKAGTPGEKA